MSDRILEAEYENKKPHIAFMTGQIQCRGEGAGRIMAELSDREGQQRFTLAAGAHAHSGPSDDVACNSLTLPIPPGWKAKCFRIEIQPGIETNWAEID